MSGDTRNPRIWVNAEVRTTPDLDVPTTLIAAIETGGWASGWGAGWDDLGLLSEDGLTQTRDQEVTDHYAHGGILWRTTKSKQKRTIQVTALEDNAVVFPLVNPGSTAEAIGGGITHRTIKIPQPDPRGFGLELRDGPIIARRIIPLGEISEVGEESITDNEGAAYPLTINIYPDGDGVLFHEFTNNPAAIPASA